LASLIIFSSPQSLFDSTIARSRGSAHTANLVFRRQSTQAYAETVSVDAKQRALQRIIQLSRSGLDVAAFFREAGESLTAAIPACTPPCWTTFDPASLLITGAYEVSSPEVPPEMFALEFLEDEPLRSTDVARSTRGVQTLHEATRGDPARSRQVTPLPNGRPARKQEDRQAVITGFSDSSSARSD
jgi:hypothetical protein